LDEAMVGGQLPGDFISRINQISSGKFPLNASTMYQMQKAASAQSKGNPALGIFKSAIDDEMAAMADELGGSVGLAKDVLLAARKAARDRFSLQEAVPAFKQVADGTLTPEKFLQQHILAANVAQVKQLWSVVNDPEARRAVAAMLVDHLKKTATATGGENPTFAQASFNKAINAPGMPQKLEIVLGAEGLAEVRRAGRIAEAVIRHPSGSKVNTSNTSQAVINQMSLLMNNTLGIPGVGPMIGAPLNLTVQRLQAAQAGDAGGLLAKGSPYGQIDERRARLIAGLLAGPSGLLTSGEFSR
jgi:hypothetical protein